MVTRLNARIKVELSGYPHFSAIADMLMFVVSSNRFAVSIRKFSIYLRTGIPTRRANSLEKYVLERCTLSARYSVLNGCANPSCINEIAVSNQSEFAARRGSTVLISIL